MECCLPQGIGDSASSYSYLFSVLLPRRSWVDFFLAGGWEEDRSSTSGLIGMTASSAGHSGRGKMALKWLHVMPCSLLICRGARWDGCWHSFGWESTDCTGFMAVSLWTPASLSVFCRQEWKRGDGTRLTGRCSAGSSVAHRGPGWTACMVLDF